MAKKTTIQKPGLTRDDSSVETDDLEQLSSDIATEPRYASSADNGIYTYPEPQPDDDDTVSIEDGEELINQIESDMGDQWRTDFEAMDPDEQQITLYNILVERVFWHIAYYMRRFPERMGSAKPMYSDRCVGIEEVRELMGKSDNTGFGKAWLEANAIPEMDEIIDRLMILNAQIETMMNCRNESAIAKLKRNFKLTDIEMSILATLVIAMREEAVLRLMCVAWADFSVRLPTVSFIANLLGDTPEVFEAVKEALCEQAILRKIRLVTGLPNPSFIGMTPLIYTQLSVDQEVIDGFCGLNNARELPRNIIMHQKGLPLDKLFCNPELLEELKFELARPKARVYLIGEPHSGRRTLLCALQMSIDPKPILELNIVRELENLPVGDIPAYLSGILRRTLLYGGILMMRFDGYESSPDIIHKIVTHQTEFKTIINRYPGSIFMLSPKHYTVTGEDYNAPTLFTIPPLTVEKSEEIWKTVLLPHTDDEYTASRMALAFSRSYSLPVGSIIRTVAAAVDAQLSLGCEKVSIKSQHVLKEIQKTFDHQLGTLAEVSISDIALSNVVLNEDCKTQVKDILEYARHLYTVLFTWGFNKRSPYGNSLSMLFAGPPGTGKTLLANAIANELGKVLYRVDLSRIVDKYIGETEKNLGRVFDEASKAHAIILFDEADALFAKRTEVKSSNDRHANQEINFLLQKLESYNGITILTTNLGKSIDEAFRRRIRFIVEFPMPDARARAALWKRMIPPQAPIEKGIRWSWLADTFEMSGGYIRNAVLKASISAAADGTPIQMKHLARAAVDEAHAMGMLLRFSEDDYAEYDGEFDDDTIEENEWFKD